MAGRGWGQLERPNGHFLLLENTYEVFFEEESVCWYRHWSALAVASGGVRRFKHEMKGWFIELGGRARVGAVGTPKRPLFASIEHL